MAPLILIPSVGAWLALVALSSATGVVPVKSSAGSGHICPVGPYFALTADHVFPASGLIRFKRGWLVRYNWDSALDLAGGMLKWERFGSWFTISKRVPRVGGVVRIIGYDNIRRRTQRVVRARVTEVGGGIMEFDLSPGPGSSGSCILDEAGEVVGINTSMRTWGDGRRTGVGTVVVIPVQQGGVQGSRQ